MNLLIKYFSKIIRVSVIGLSVAVGVYIVARIIPGVNINNIVEALIVTIVVAGLNSIILPILNKFALPLTVATLGIGSLVLNGILLWLLSNFIPGFYIEGLLSSILFIFGIAIVTIIVSWLLAIDDDETYHRNVIKKQAQRSNFYKDTKTPGVIFLQIDGLAFSVLRRAIQSGNVPNITKWIREGKYRLERWETDWQSQTGASQAGILMGSNKNIPAFRWYDKKLGRTIAFGSPKDLKYLEDKLSNGKGLLFNNGASRGNLFSGNADDTMLTVSSIGKKSKKGFGHGYFAYYSNPYNLPRTITLFIVEIFREVKSIIEQGRRDVWPRLTHHKKIYPLLRASMTIVQRDIIIQTLIGDIYEGKDTVYADLVGYDEVSHHTGPERYETLAVLRDIDRQVARLISAIEDSEKPYHLVLLSDHGQTQGATFKQMTGKGLDELIKEIIGDEKSVSGEMDNAEDKNILNNAALELTKTGGLVGKSLNSAKKTKKKITKKTKTSKIDTSEIKVLASGALGLIYFTKYNDRLKLEKINKLHPNLINELVNNPLIGFVLVDSKKGGIVIGKGGKYFIKSDKIEGKNPLSIFDHFGL